MPLTRRIFYNSKRWRLCQDNGSNLGNSQYESQTCQVLDLIYDIISLKSISSVNLAKSRKPGRSFDLINTISDSHLLRDVSVSMLLYRIAPNPT